MPYDDHAVLSFTLMMDLMVAICSLHCLLCSHRVTEIFEEYIIKFYEINFHFMLLNLYILVIFNYLNLVDDVP